MDRVSIEGRRKPRASNYRDEDSFPGSRLAGNPLSREPAVDSLGLLASMPQVREREANAYLFFDNQNPFDCWRVDRNDVFYPRNDDVLSPRVYRVAVLCANAVAASRESLGGGLLWLSIFRKFQAAEGSEGHTTLRCRLSKFSVYAISSMTASTAF